MGVGWADKADTRVFGPSTRMASCHLPRWKKPREKQIWGRVEIRASALNLLSFRVCEIPSGHMKWVVVCGRLDGDRELRV